MTTRRLSAAASPPEPCLVSCRRPRGCLLAAAAAVPPRHAAGAPQAPPGASAAAWPPASDAPPPGIPALGSSAGSTAGPETSARILCAGKSAIPAAGPWRTHAAFRWYAGSVPWEVMTPWGRPGRMSLILLGHSPVAPLSLSACRPATAVGEPCLRRSRKETREGRDRSVKYILQAVVRWKRGRRFHVFNEGVPRWRRRANAIRSGNGFGGRRCRDGRLWADDEGVLSPRGALPSLVLRVAP